MSLFRLVGTAVAVAGVLVAQENAPTGIVRGDLIEFAGDKAQGEILLRTPPDRIYSCHFDGSTYLEKEGHRLALSALNIGDRLEVVTDRKPGSQRCYARTVRVMDKTEPVVNPGYRVNLRRSTPTGTMVDQLYPRGNLTFSGVIIRLNPQMMVVRTRAQGETTILLRQDTHYMDSGLSVEASTLAVNIRVSIRGGRNLDNELEAYQVIWGAIPGP